MVAAARAVRALHRKRAATERVCASILHLHHQHPTFHRKRLTVAKAIFCDRAPLCRLMLFGASIAPTIRLTSVCSLSGTRHSTSPTLLHSSTSSMFRTSSCLVQVLWLIQTALQERSVARASTTTSARTTRFDAALSPNAAPSVSTELRLLPIRTRSRSSRTRFRAPIPRGHCLRMCSPGKCTTSPTSAATSAATSDSKVPRHANPPAKSHGLSPPSNPCSLSACRASLQMRSTSVGSPPSTTLTRIHQALSVLQISSLAIGLKWKPRFKPCKVCFWALCFRLSLCLRACSFSLQTSSWRSGPFSR